jgi:hypothetical protein
MRYLLIALTICITISACYRSNEKGKYGSKEKILDTIPIESINLNFLAEIDSSLFKLVSNSKDSIQIIFFDANCSICMAKFVEFIGRSEPNHNFSYLYIVAADDMNLVEYYLNKFGVNLHQNEYLILNKNKEFESDNPLINWDATPKIITDYNLAIVSIEYLNDY